MSLYLPVVGLLISSLPPLCKRRDLFLIGIPRDWPRLKHLAARAFLGHLPQALGCKIADPPVECQKWLDGDDAYIVPLR